MTAVDPDRLAELEEERRFLLRSLRDLDAELAAGDVDGVDYVTLRDDYTKRAADVLRAIEEGKAALPARPAGRWTRNLAIVAVVVAAALAAGVLVARTSGQRTGADEMTGGIGIIDTAGKLAQARALLGVEPRQAQDLYAEVLDEDPQNAEALAYSGWLLYLASTGASDDVRAEAVATARDQLDKAVAADPQYPDPHCFLAIVALRVDADTTASQTESDRCIALDAPAQIAAYMRSLTAPPSSVPGSAVPGG